METRPQAGSLRKRSLDALQDSQLQRNLRKILPQVLHSHDTAVEAVPNWEELREYAHQVRAHTMSHLDKYLVDFEERVIELGGKVFWAETGEQAAEFIVELAHHKGIRRIVKSKSMLGEEIGLNETLERAGMETVETDLGEYIVQLAGQPPSHIVAPALHLSREEIAGLLETTVGLDPTRDAERITAKARDVLRKKFVDAQMGISGVNFGVADTGTVVVVENEGNARLSVSAPDVHVAVMGIEKVIPRVSDLPVFLKLLTRSATGQKITSYVNLLHGPRREGELDGPSEFHLVLVDNGRSRMLTDELLRQTLFCIRCGACLTACPVYQNIGGHAYGSTYSGPIGAILTPQLDGLGKAPEHPFASSLCGACVETCPVKIEIPHVLLELRHRVKREHAERATRIPLERFAFQIWSHWMSSPGRYERMSRWLRRLVPEPLQRMRIPFPPFNRWSKDRETPTLAPRSFREIYQAERRDC